MFVFPTLNGVRSGSLGTRVPLLHVLLEARGGGNGLPGVLVDLGLGVAGVGHAAGAELGLLLGVQLEAAGGEFRETDGLERDGGGGEDSEEGGGELRGGRGRRGGRLEVGGVAASGVLIALIRL